MSWDITGYNAGGRRPLTNGLRASKFRGMGSPHYLQANTYIQNNYYGNMSYRHMFDCHAADYNCFGGGGMSNTGKWMFGLGAIFSAIGNMFGAFMPQKEDGVGDAPGNGTNTDDDLKNLRTLYPDYNIVLMSDSKYYATPKDGVGTLSAGTSQDLSELIDKKEAEKNKEAPTVDPKEEN